MSNTTIDWTANCITVGVHNGRNDERFFTTLLNVDLSKDEIKELVREAIEDDAQMFVDHGQPKVSQQWAYMVKELWADYFDAAYEKALANSQKFDHEADDATKSRRDIDEGRPVTNPYWNDHITYICRVCGVAASIKASRIVGV